MARNHQYDTNPCKIVSWTTLDNHNRINNLLIVGLLAATIDIKMHVNGIMSFVVAHCF